VRCFLSSPLFQHLRPPINSGFTVAPLLLHCGWKTSLGDDSSALLSSAPPVTLINGSSVAERPVLEMLFFHSDASTAILSLRVLALPLPLTYSALPFHLCHWL